MTSEEFRGLMANDRAETDRENKVMTKELWKIIHYLILTEINKQVPIQTQYSHQASKMTPNSFLIENRSQTKIFLKQSQRR